MPDATGAPAGAAGTCPRHCPDSTPRASMNSLNRSRSRLTCIWSTPMVLPTFSTTPCGSQARSTVTRVSSVDSGSKVTVPLCWTSPSVLCQAMRSSGRCSTISASNSRWAPPISVTQCVAWLLSCCTATTPDMNAGNVSNCVHWLYAVRTGTRTSTDAATSLMGIGPFRRGMRQIRRRKRFACPGSTIANGHTRERVRDDRPGTRRRPGNAPGTPAGGDRLHGRSPPHRQGWARASSPDHHEHDDDEKNQNDGADADVHVPSRESTVVRVQATGCEYWDRVAASRSAKRACESESGVVRMGCPYGRSAPAGDSGARRTTPGVADQLAAPRSHSHGVAGDASATPPAAARDAPAGRRGSRPPPGRLRAETL